MKMSSAWASMALENTGLKTTLICLTVVSIALTTLLFEVNSKEPLIIERGCFSKSISMVGSQQTKEEIETFIRQALSERFDSDAKTSDFIDAELRGLKTKEQADLAARQMRQFVHVNSIKGDQGAYSVDADRIIAVGALRSALKFPLSIKIAAVSRSPSNPYGLLLTDVVQMKESKDEK